MKIAYFTDTFLPQVNGIATSLANQAKTLGEAGHNVLIFIPKLDGIKREKFEAKNVTIVHLPTVPSLIYTEFKFGVFGLPRVIKYLTKFNPDIIHLHSPLTIGMDAILAAKIFKKPLVGTIHIYLTNADYYLGFVKYKLAVKLLDKVSQRYLNFLYGQCDLLLSPSKLLVGELSKNGFKKEVRYLPNGIILDQPKFLSTKEKDKLKQKYSLKEKVVLHFGRLSYEKNIDVLIKSFSELVQNHQDVSLLIIGDGPSKTNLIKLTKKIGLEKEVIFTGFIDNQYLLSSGILGIGDVFATASTMEVNPMAVLEAMSYGLPIVGVKQAGLIELVSTNGFLVKPGDIRQLTEKIEKILYDTKMASQMRAQSLELIKQYSVEKTAKKLLGFYRNLQKLFAPKF